MNTIYAVQLMMMESEEEFKQNKFKGEPSTHQSKGIHLTQLRLDLDNVMNKRNATLDTTDKRCRRKIIRY